MDKDNLVDYVDAAVEAEQLKAKTDAAEAVVKALDDFVDLVEDDIGKEATGYMAEFRNHINRLRVAYKLTALEAELKVTKTEQKILAEE